MNVEIESKRSVNITAMIAGARLSFSAPRISSLKKTLLKSGRLNSCGGRVSRPSAHAAGRRRNAQLCRNRFRDRFAHARHGNHKEQHPRPENYSKGRRPRHAFAENDRVGKERVDAHAGGDRERQLRVHTHQQCHRKTDEHGPSKDAAKRQSRFAACRDDLWIDDDDVCHRKESGDAGDRFSFEIGCWNCRVHEYEVNAVRVGGWGLTQTSLDSQTRLLTQVTSSAAAECIMSAQTNAELS